MRSATRCMLIAVCCLGGAAEARADWQAVERVEPYAVSGQTGAELYASIGERGPGVAGKPKAIAYTNFKLTWTRRYEPKADACVLVSARPKLVITYTLPKAPSNLSADVRQRWARFIDGVRKHERVHADIIVAMVRKIEAASVGLSVGNDPQCSKIRAELTRRLAGISREQRQQSREFDRAELSDGGTVHQLVLDLVNGH